MILNKNMEKNDIRIQTNLNICEPIISTSGKIVVLPINFDVEFDKNKYIRIDFEDSRYNIFIESRVDVMPPIVFTYPIIHGQTNRLMKYEPCCESSKYNIIIKSDVQINIDNIQIRTI